MARYHLCGKVPLKSGTVRYGMVRYGAPCSANVPFGPECQVILSSATAQTRNKKRRGSHTTQSHSLKFTMSKHTACGVLCGTHTTCTMHDYCMGPMQNTTCCRGKKGGGGAPANFVPTSDNKHTQKTKTNCSCHLALSSILQLG